MTLCSRNLCWRTIPALIALATLAGCKGDAANDTGASDTSDTSGIDSAIDTNDIPNVRVDIRIDGGDTLSPDPESASVRLCSSGDSITVAWIDNRSGTADVWINASQDAGVTWFTMPVNASATTGDAKNPSMACSGGNVHVVWEDTQGSQFDNDGVWSATSTNGGATWSAAAELTVDSDFEHESNDPVVAVQGSNVAVTWAANPGGGYDTYVVASHDSGASFGDPVRVESDSAGASYSAHPQLAFVGGSDLRVVWEDRRTGTMTIRTARSTNGGDSFGTDRTVSDGVTDAFNVRIAADSGEAYASWHQGQAGERLDVYAAHSPDSTTNFSDAVRISADDAGARDDLRPRVVVSQGFGHVAWYTETGGGYHIRYAKLDDGAAVGTPMAIDVAGDTNLADRPTIAEGANMLIIGWEDNRHSNSDSLADLFVTTSTDIGASWSENARLSSSLGGVTTQTDLSLSGNAELVFAAWSDAREGTSDVYFNTITGGAR